MRNFSKSLSGNLLWDLRPGAAPALLLILLLSGALPAQDQAPAEEAGQEETEDCLPCGGEKNGLLGDFLGEQGLRPGEPAPIFALPTLEGEREVRSSEAFAARPLTALILWNSSCLDCLRAVVQCGAFAARADSLGVGMLSINFDREHMAAVRAFVKGEKLPFPVLWDPEGKAVQQYRAAAYSFSLFLVDRKGTVRFVRYDRPAEVRSLLTAEVAKALKHLEAGKTLLPEQPTD